MNKTQKTLYYIRSVIIFLICIFGITLFFYSSSFLETLIAHGLKLRVLPSYTGGETAQDFFDDSGDDTGSGILCYPTNSRFTEGALDLIRYTVHKPVFGAQWQQNPEYWQLDVEYKNGPADVRNILIYIDIDGNGDGSTETLAEGAENITFDPAHPWDFAIHFCGGNGKVFDAKKQFICETENSVLKDGARILIRIPLIDKRLQKIYTAEKTYHYVLTGGYSEWDRGSFMPIEEKRTISKGGTQNASQFSTLIPKLFDILDDSTNTQFSQKAQLASWNKDSFEKAVVYPLSVSMKETETQTNSEDVSSEIFAAYEAFQATQAESNPTSEASKLERAVLAFNKGETSNAELLLAEIIKEQPENAKALAYYGSCIATKGGNASVIQAVKLVNDAFVYLDKAASLSEQTPDEIDVLMNRATVCRSVPNAVFGKAETGAEDFVKCAQLYKKTADMNALSEENRLFLAYVYTCAAECYKTAGKETEAMLNTKEAKKLWK